MQQSVHGCLRIKLSSLIAHLLEQIDRFLAGIVASTAQSIKPLRRPRSIRNRRFGLGARQQEWLDFRERGPQLFLVGSRLLDVTRFDGVPDRSADVPLRPTTIGPVAMSSGW